MIDRRGGDAQREAFLDAGPKAIDYLEARSELKLEAALAHPDYLKDHPGAAYGGRALGPFAFYGHKLGADFAFLLAPFKAVKNSAYVTKSLTRHGSDRLRYKRGTRLVKGNAIVARLLYSLRQNNMPIQVDTSLAELVREKLLLAPGDSAGREAGRRRAMDAVTRYLKAVAALDVRPAKDSGLDVVTIMKRMPTDDCFGKGSIRASGRVLHLKLSVSGQIGGREQEIMGFIQEARKGRTGAGIPSPRRGWLQAELRQ